MGIFRFKQFSVINEKSAMKVNTDGVLLGAASILPQSDRLEVLDIGTGTGTVALILAQRLCGRSDFHISGIDIDKDSAEEASVNFANSPWRDSMVAVNVALQDFVAAEKFDVIVSNPPYFDNSLVNPDGRKTAARHTGGLSYREIIDFAAGNLNDDGILSLILPADEEQRLLRYGRMRRLFARRILYIRTSPTKRPSRIVVGMMRSRNSGDVGIHYLTIQEKGKYTDEYISLTEDFYL